MAPLASIAALLIALAVFTAAQEPSDDLLATAPLRSRMANIIRILATVVVGIASLVVIALADPLVSVSAVAALAGEGLLVAGFTSIRYAWTLPTLHLLVALTFGAAGRLDLAPWAWIVSTTPSPTGSSVSLALMLTGMTLWLTHHARAAGRSGGTV